METARQDSWLEQKQAYRHRLFALVVMILGCVWTTRGLSAQDFDDQPLSAWGENETITPLAFDALFAEDAPPPEEPKSLEERLGDLEGKYSDLEKNYDKLKEDHSTLKGKLKTLVNAGHSDSVMKIRGRMHTDLWGFPGNSPGTNAFETGDPLVTPQDRFGFRRVRFGVGGEVWQTMEYRVEMEFAGGNRPEFRDCYMGWHDVPFFQRVLVGNQKRPYGLDQINSSNQNVFMERPFIVEGDDQDARRFGIVSYGVSEDQAWNWRYGVFNLRNIQDEGYYVSDHYQGEFASRLANTFWYDETSGGRGYGHWAIASTFADPDSSGLPGRATNEARFQTRPEARTSTRWLDTGEIAGADDYQVLGFENVLNFGALQFVGEYLHTWVDRDGFQDVEFPGGYVYVAYFLTGEFMPWDRATGQLARVEPLENFFLVDTCNDGIRGGWGAWQIAYRWSYADFTDQDILGGIGESHTLGLNWYWNAFAKMQFNAIYGEIDDHAPVAGFTSGHYTALGTRFMIDF
jgi:phosphate-selective porin OprO and OprP